MIFHEIYGCYYNAVAKILASAVDGELTDDKLIQIVRETAFSESFLTIIPALKTQKWQLLDEDFRTPLRNTPMFRTPLRHTPTMPLTTLQKRWLKAISIDPRIKLFNANLAGLDDVQPLFTPEEYVVFDKYTDGDPYEDEKYINNFHTILNALHTGKKLRVCHTNRKGCHREHVCFPTKLEYSEKDDKFRILITGCRNVDTINVARLIECSVVDEYPIKPVKQQTTNKDFFVMELVDDRNALERVMLHFAHFEKQAEKIADNKYKVTVYYDRDDETELVIRVLSFGPMVKVTDTSRFVELIKERLMMQKKCNLK